MKTGFTIINLSNGYYDVSPFGYGEYIDWTPETIERECERYNAYSLNKKNVEEIIYSVSDSDDDINTAWTKAKERMFELQFEYC